MCVVTVVECDIQAIPQVQLIRRDDNYHVTSQLQLPFFFRVLTAIWTRDEYSVDDKNVRFVNVFSSMFISELPAV